ncbi:hypothetical protein JTB14_015958 [Gonioctena quinquepunctata]|nr:hypothetical protein JTB14_015958 [Gonioctena quinquepunctata]
MYKQNEEDTSKKSVKHKIKEFLYEKNELKNDDISIADPVNGRINMEIRESSVSNESPGENMMKTEVSMENVQEI